MRVSILVLLPAVCSSLLIRAGVNPIRTTTAPSATLGTTTTTTTTTDEYIKLTAEQTVLLEVQDKSRTLVEEVEMQTESNTTLEEYPKTAYVEVHDDHEEVEDIKSFESRPEDDSPDGPSFLSSTSSIPSQGLQTLDDDEIQVLCLLNVLFRLTQIDLDPEPTSSLVDEIVDALKCIFKTCDLYLQKKSPKNINDRKFPASI